MQIELPILSFFRTNYQFLILCLIWLAIGMYGGPLIYLVLPATLLLLKQKARYQDLLIGFIFILVLSDSRLDSLAFAANIKAIYLILLSIFFFFDQKKFFPLNKFYLIFIPYFLLGFFLVTQSELKFTSFQKILSYTLLVIIIPNYVSKLYKDLGDRFLTSIIYFVCILMIVGLLLIYINPSVAFDIRFRGILGNPNGLGLFCSIFFIFYSLIIHTKPTLFLQWEKIAIYSLILLSIILSGSRNALLTIFIYIFFSRFFRISPFIGFIIFLVLMVTYQVISNNLVSIIQALNLEEYFRLESLSTLSNRVYAWQYAWIAIQDNFYFGKGFAHDEFVFQQFDSFRASAGAGKIVGRVANVHNSFLGIWLNTGLVGLVLFCSALISKFIKAAQNSKLAFPIIFAIVFSANFEAWLMASLNPFTIQLFILLTLITMPSFSSNDQIGNKEKRELPSKEKK